MPFPKVTKQDVLDKLKNIGVQQNDIIYVASFVAILGNQAQILDDTIDAFMEAVGPKGTVVMPTFNWDYCSKEPFDPEKTPSQVGTLTELFRKRPGVLRSITPPWCTFAAIGKLSSEIVAIKGTSPFGADSITQFLYDLNARYVLLGCPYKDGVIHTHWLEEKYAVPYRFWKQFKGRVIINGKESMNVSYMYARDLKINADIDPSPLTNLFEKSGKVRVEKLGLGEIRSFTTKDYCEFMIPYLEKDRLAFLMPEYRKSFDGSRKFD